MLWYACKSGALQLSCSLIYSVENLQGTEPSKQLYATFLETMRKLYQPERIQDGEFGAM